MREKKLKILDFLLFEGIHNFCTLLLARMWMYLNEQIPMVCLECLENKYFPRDLIFYRMLPAIANPDFDKSYTFDRFSSWRIFLELPSHSLRDLFIIIIIFHV